MGERLDITEHMHKREEWTAHYISHWGTLPPAESNSHDLTEGLPTWLPWRLGSCMFKDAEGV